MHRHRAATFLLGLWFAGILAITFVATRNFRIADEILTHPSAGAAKLMAPLQRSDARLLLRHEAAELNRLYFNTFEWGEIVLGILIVILLFPMANPSRPWLILAVGLLITTLFMHFALTPEITSIGQGLDFIDPAVNTPERIFFWRLHSAYSAAEVLKLLAILALTTRILYTRGHRKARPNESRHTDLSPVDLREARR